MSSHGNRAEYPHMLAADFANRESLFRRSAFFRLLSFCRAGRQNISPVFFRNCTCSNFLRHFCINTTGYLHAHVLYAVSCEQLP